MDIDLVEEVDQQRPGHLRSEPWRGGVAGMAAAAVALGCGELVASFASWSPSLVSGVGAWLIDRSPGDVTRTAIDALGARNKPVLLGGIIVTTILLGAWFGRRSVEARAIGVLGFCGFAVLGALAAAGEPGATTVGTFVVAGAAAASGVATLMVLLATGDGQLPLTTALLESPTDPRASRRMFLGFAGAATAFAGLAATGARTLAGRSAAEEARDGIVLPAPVTPAPVVVSNEISGVPGLSPLHTPNDSFFRIDTALTVPQVDPTTWTLTIDGLVDDPITLSFDELQEMPMVEVDVTLVCVSNTVGGNLVGNARWLGVPLLDLLERVGVQPDASQVVGRSVDGFTAGFPLAVVTPDRPALVAIGMNGEPLPIIHGFPARLVVSGLFGYVSATKWLERIELTTWEGFDGYWIPRGWSKEGPIHTQARIDVPRDRAELRAGITPIAGVAWAPSRGVTAVEVQVDDGPWLSAELSEPIGDHAWRQWVVRWDATPGAHAITVRTTDGTGEVQTELRSVPDPSGATGRHRVAVQVLAS